MLLGLGSELNDLCFLPGLSLQGYVVKNSAPENSTVVLVRATKAIENLACQVTEAGIAAATQGLKIRLLASRATVAGIAAAVQGVKTTVEEAERLRQDAEIFQREEKADDLRQEATLVHVEHLVEQGHLTNAVQVRLALLDLLLANWSSHQCRMKHRAKNPGNDSRSQPDVRVARAYEISRRTMRPRC